MRISRASEASRQVEDLRVPDQRGLRSERRVALERGRRAGFHPRLDREVGRLSMAVSRCVDQSQ